MKVNFFAYNYKNYPAFNGRGDVMAKVDKFNDEIIAASASGDLPIEKVQEISSKYIPEIKIKPLSCNSKKYKDLGGLYHSGIRSHTTPPRAEIEERILKLKLFGNKRNFHEYLATIAHEMTHALQAADKDLRDDKLITESLQGLPIEEWGNQIDIGYENFTRIESEMLKPIILAYRETKFLNNENYFFDTWINRAKFKKALDSKLEQIKENHPSANMDFIKKLFYLQAMNEFDAYTTDENFKKKLDENYEKDDFIPYLYLCFADCLDVEGVE